MSAVNRLNVLKENETKMNQYLRSLYLKNIIEQPLYYRLRSTSTSLSVMYDQPKVHRNGYPLRPIISSVGSYNYELSRHLAQIIQRYRTPPPSFVKDSFQFVERIKNIDYEDGQIMVNFDIESLYTNIPVYEAIETALDLIYVDGIKPNDAPYCRDKMKELLKLAICDVPFRFQAELYKQKDGAAMGSCLAPILVDVLMIKLEQKLNKLSFNKPQLYLRHRNTHFTAEVENNGQLPYLDVMIMRNSNDRRYDTTLYKKPTDTGLYLLYESNQCR
ncbi:unnamed protein product, partial [Didymodactylos carnosus]